MGLQGQALWLKQNSVPSKDKAIYNPRSFPPCRRPEDNVLEAKRQHYFILIFKEFPGLDKSPALRTLVWRILNLGVILNFHGRNGYRSQTISYISPGNSAPSRSRQTLERIHALDLTEQFHCINLVTEEKQKNQK